MGTTDTNAATLGTDVLAALDETIEHFNANHADTVLFLVHHGAGRLDADDAEVTGVDRFGVDFDIAVDGAPDRARLMFEQPVANSFDVYDQILAKVGEARTAVGERVPLTSFERELAATASLSTFVSHVAEVTDLSPNLREIVLEGGFDGFVSQGGDQFVYLMVRRPGGPDVPADHTIAAQSEADPATGPIAAYYTVRAWDADRQRMTLWLVRHGHDHGVGGWAGRCEIGERVALWGPRAGFGVQHDATTHLLVADESGVAAVAALLDELGPAARVRVIVETIDEGHVVELPTRAGVELIWLYRGEEPPGTGARLLDAVRSLDLQPHGLVAFGAGESHEVTTIRKYLRHELGLPADRVSMTGYWRRVDSR